MTLERVGILMGLVGGLLLSAHLLGKDRVLVAESKARALLNVLANPAKLVRLSVLFGTGVGLLLAIPAMLVSVVCVFALSRRARLYLLAANIRPNAWVEAPRSAQGRIDAAANYDAWLRHHVPWMLVPADWYEATVERIPTPGRWLWAALFGVTILLVTFTITYAVSKSAPRRPVPDFLAIAYGAFAFLSFVDGQVVYMAALYPFWFATTAVWYSIVFVLCLLAILLAHVLLMPLYPNAFVSIVLAQEEDRNNERRSHDRAPPGVGRIGHRVRQCRASLGSRQQ